MVSEKIDKKVEWLEGERREALNRIDDLEKRLAQIEASSEAKQNTINKLEKELKALAKSSSDYDTVDKEMDALREKLNKEISALDEKQKQRVKEMESRLLAEQQGAGKAIDEFRKRISEIDGFRSTLEGLEEQNAGFDKRVEELQGALDEEAKSEERREKVIKSFEEDNAKDAKRLAAMEGDLSAALEHIEKVVTKNETITEQQRTLLRRLDTVVEAEEKRRAGQKDFLDKANTDRVANERKFTEWEKRFEDVVETSKKVNAHIKNIETVELNLKRAQQSFDDLVEKINRRVNEINEIQRLGEQRFRQEWSTFQADSQKRWSNFTLDQEETQKESTRQREKLAKQTAELEETMQEVQDLVQHLSEQNERYLQSVLEAVRDALSENERFFGSLG